MRVIPATQARAKFQDVIDSVHYTKEPVIISKKDKPWVMIQPLTETDKELKELIKKKTK